ncbi:MAG: 2-oxoacid:acceptor oxidoreductase subunit alpha [SAR202 cluster bacterium]|jgi:2-oxoglutarate ferredoxin oxidoreductase subunit alpha|nr:2-oxoglutarate synthase subunit alpha [Chloroflexota bacterium]MDP6420523.1 2-oxoacid:acceptor oxidoreductase subunit alpha [SAR202 cluster bacterium]HAL48591.1 2-oxoacid:acceptor oxidoreductase subunit alpha [Dehalococcoidia bacterium]MDP6664003.1 2-oxoacid:acceptor oxidoreductase subunit alpha [SAR202 cluster bacterium]MDP6799188.1 2-oxoacid:acceptor oxidoreductase subunit alpha [SAR202 cluster bacterium]|tara:strand:+ start:1076 stop:2269 length:1194 start_codon:yes stop_codon:yes gene_type:complete
MTSSAALTGKHFMLGDAAIAEGAIAAGCRFFGGYPITPSTETAERMATRLPQVGGTFMQMEDELGSMAVILGAAWAGHKTMTATSGPGFSLMAENLGLGIITETPTVICNVQRAAPSTGLPTLVAQGDMMQARWGSHGHYEIIAVVPWSVQECFDITIRAFNLAERYRTPVLIMADAEVGHLIERLEIPDAADIEIWDRKRPTGPKDQYKSFEVGDDLIPPMASAGEGYRVFCESLTHDERGYPETTAEAHQQLVGRLVEKIRMHRFDIYDYEEQDVDGADVVVVSYGISARISVRAIALARERGIKVGSLRLKTVWPFPEERIRELSNRIKGFVVPEINLGQMVLEVQRCSLDSCGVVSVPHAGGEIHDPEQILEAIVKAHEGKAPTRAELVASGE